MYIYKDKVNQVDIYWEPYDVNLGVAIVKEVTEKDSTRENPVIVTASQRDEIARLYDERNNDPVEEVGEEQSKEEKLIEEIMANQIVTFETLATIYESNELNNFNQMEVLATIYESSLEV